MGPDPAVAALRLAVRRELADLSPGSTVLVACSGGADSLALLAATAFESARGAYRVVAVCVDHGLQRGSADVAALVVDRARAMGVESVVVPVEVSGGGGPEAAARASRYAALDRVAEEHSAAVVLLGHTRDDQAETVLLGLARGAGARALAGMAPAAGRYRRPLLALTREQTLAASLAQDLRPWQDPHNDDARFSRVRVRHRVLPVLEAELGPGVAAALARTAGLLREDADALDLLAGQAATRARESEGAWSVAVLEALLPAVRRRVLRRAALLAGCPGGELFAVHVLSLDALVTGWRGQVGVDLPGHVRAHRAGGSLRFVRRAVAG